MSNYKDITGNELELMLMGCKPMAAFCRAIKDRIDEFSGQDFFYFVRLGRISYNYFYISEDYGKVIYSVFTINDQKWRFDLYKLLKKSKTWSSDHDLIESFLLGYRDNLD